MGVRLNRVVLPVLVALLAFLNFAIVATAQTSAPRDTPLDTRDVQNKSLRVVIVGLVHGHAEGFFSNAIKRTDIQIAGVQEPDRSLFDRYAKKYGLDAGLYHADVEEMLNATKPQAALLYTSTFDHRKMVEICAKHHIPVMMEKPLAVSADDAHAIARAAAEAQIPVMVNYFTTWEPSRHGAYEVVKQGTIGEVRRVIAHDGHGGPKEIGVGPEFLGWLTDPKLNGGGALYDFGCYGVDFMTWLMGGESPLTVTAVTMQIKPDVYPKVDDDATIVITYPKAVAIIEGSWNWPFGQSLVHIYGKTGEVKTIGRDQLEIRTAGESAAKTEQAPALMPPEDDELRYLRAVVLEGLKPSGQSSLAVNVVVAEVMDAARRSSQTGRTVKMSEVKK